ncbi:unannotated protein [freshwater metagenome]|uniref:Unannotated protein n=1 Tax=freshwater metagenome TaxID=449393 RepID=A0A6J7G2W8_9ZZZZ
MRSESTRHFQGVVLEVDRDDPSCSGSASDRHDEGTDRTGPDDENRLAGHRPSTLDGMPCDARWLGQRSNSQIQTVRQHSEHSCRDGDVTDEQTVVVRYLRGASHVAASGRQVRTIDRILRAGGGGSRRMDSDRGAFTGATAVSCAPNHGARRLVPQSHRRFQYRLSCRPMLPVVQIGAADSAVGNCDDGLVRRGVGHRHCFDADVIGAVRDQGNRPVGHRVRFGGHRVVRSVRGGQVRPGRAPDRLRWPDRSDRDPEFPVRRMRRRAPRRP